MSGTKCDADNIILKQATHCIEFQADLLTRCGTSLKFSVAVNTVSGSASQSNGGEATRGGQASKHSSHLQQQENNV